MSPAHSDFLLITIAAWGAGVIVLLLTRWVRWETPRRAADAVFYSLLTAFAVTFATLGVLRHEALNSHSYDLAVYDQVVWNLSQGRWFQTSLEYYVFNFLGDHLSLSLAFVAPLYRIYSSPHVLIALQPVAMALAGLPVYWWARERLTSGPALAVGLSYMVFVPMIYVIAIDFHDIVLAAPLLSFAAYYMLRDNIGRFVLFAFPALLVKEEVGLLVAALGLYWLLGRSRYVLGAGTAVLGLSWALAAMLIIIPTFNPEGGYYYLGRDTSLGMSQSEFLMSFLVRPGEAVSQVVTPEKTRYVLHLLTPLAFVPVLGPGLLALAFPTLGYLLLRGESPQFLIITQYAAPIVPFLFFASVRGIARSGSQRRAVALSAALLVASGASYYWHSPGPLSKNFVPQRYLVSSRAETGKQLMASIPPEAGVIAQSDLVPHLSRRQRVYMFPEVPGYEGIDYILFDQLGNRYPLSNPGEAYERAVAEVMANPDFRRIEDKEGYVLLKRTAEVPVSRVASLGDRVRLYGYALESDSASGFLTVSLYWEALSSMTEDYSLFIHVMDSQGGRLAQWDGPPLGPYLPTSQWGPGVRLRGNYGLTVPAEMISGGYRLEVGLYDWKTLERLSVTDASGSAQANSVVIAPGL